MLRILTSLIVILLISTVQVNAQWKDPLYESDHTVPHHMVGLFGGNAYYHGDLQKDWFPNYGQGVGGGLYYKYFYNQTVGFRSSLAYFNNIHAADSMSTSPVQKARNLRFGTNIFEGNIGFELNLNSFGIKYHNFAPFVFGGLSMFYFNPYTDSLGKRVYLKPLNTEGQTLFQYPDRQPYALISTGWTFGGGFKFLIAQKVALTTEVGFRYLSTDYFDDVSRTYVNLDTLSKYRGRQSSDFSFRGDELENFNNIYPNSGFQRGNPNDKDWYYFATISLGIYFDAVPKKREYPFTRCIRRRINNPAAL